MSDHLPAENPAPLEAMIREAVRGALREHPPGRHLTAKQLEWVEAAIKAQGRRAQLVDAIIEKSLTALALTALGFVGWAIWEHIHRLFTGLPPPPPT